MSETTRPADWMRRSQIEGLVALVVGGGSGIGAASATSYAANGGAVMVADLDGDHAREVAQGIQASGGKASFVHADAGSRESLARAVDATVAEHGRLDTVICTAAYVRPAPLESITAENWQTSFRVNVEGALHLGQLALPHLRQSPAASIVLIGSLGGVFGRPNGGGYGPSKAALIALTYQMGMEWAQYGVRVNAVNPGTIDTPMSRANSTPEDRASRAAAIPARRLGDPAEVADAVVFLASPAASYITAQTLNVDGGHSQSLLFAPLGGVGSQ